MKVILAGFNIDRGLINEVPEIKRQYFTPEVFSSAYAKISRSALPVTELRRQAIDDIKKARALNEKIIYGFGHSSVAEHAVFNIDIIGISRFAAEIVQSVKYISFTEKSQRYVKFGKDFYTPPKLKKSLLMDEISKAHKLCHENYISTIKMLKQALSNAQGLRPGALQKIKEDARYVLPLCTMTQMGMTTNARALEQLITLLRSQDSDELMDLANALYGAVSDITPSLVKYTGADDFYNLKRGKNDALPEMPDTVNFIKYPIMTYFNVPESIDEKILTAYKFRRSSMGYKEVKSWAKKLNQARKKEIFCNIFEGIKFFHLLPKEFETISVEFEAIISASCYAQLKRHRESVLITQDYSYANPVIVPELFGLSDFSYKLYQDTVKTYKNLYRTVSEKSSEYKDYYMLNCNTRRVYCRFDLRSLYNFFRLRADEHAQWEIRYLANILLEKIKTEGPMALAMACGKDEFLRTKTENIKTGEE